MRNIDALEGIIIYVHFWLNDALIYLTEGNIVFLGLDKDSMIYASIYNAFEIFLLVLVIIFKE